MYCLNHFLTYLCQIVVICKAEEVVDASASTTDDNAASGKIIGGFVSVIYYLMYQYTAPLLLLQK